MNKAIGIIGTGYVGSALGLALANAGHPVTYGTRNPESPKMMDVLEQSGSGAKALSIKEAIKDSAIVILATPWNKTEEIIKSGDNWQGKIIIDCTNPLNNDLSGLTTEPNSSAAEQIAGWAEGAEVVKAFNSIGAQVMSHPQFANDKAALFICGNSTEAKGIVKTLAEQIGFEIIDAGDLSVAHHLEQLAVFWIHLAFKQGLGTDFALKILRR